MIYPVKRIAKYIIEYSSERSKPISNLRLQKILYFIQAEFLVTKNEPCFNEDIYAWDYGPVVPCVYNEYKVYGSASIPSSDKDLSDFSILEADKRLINGVIDGCNKFSTAYLVELTHNQDPWKKARNELFDRIIKKTSIKKYFSED